MLNKCVKCDAHTLHVYGGCARDEYQSYLPRVLLMQWKATPLSQLRNI